jgi:hypothetical protein
MESGEANERVPPLRLASLPPNIVMTSYLL